MSEQDLRKLADQYYDRLFRAARFMCEDVVVAEDLVQETFLAAAGSLDSFEGRSAIYTWLYGILLNKFRRWLRKKNRRAVSLQKIAEGVEESRAEELFETEHAGPVEVVEREETVLNVREAIGELSTDHRAVITLRYLEGLSYEEIAEAVECPVGTVKSRIHYALRKIGKKLEDTEGPPQ